MEVTFQTHPSVSLGSNTFVNVPVILQYEDTPLLEVGKATEAGYTANYPVYDSQGTQIARVVGSRIHLTEAGKKANINQRHEANLVVCEVDGKPILELRKTGAASLRGRAELYAPGGVLIKAADAGVSGLLRGGGPLQIGGSVMMNSTFTGNDAKAIGIHIQNNSVGYGRTCSARIGFFMGVGGGFGLGGDR